MIVRFAWVFCMSLALGGCAGSAGPRHSADPFEPFNRSVHAFNEVLDDAVIAPAARGYVAAVPEVLRVTAANVFGNLRDVWTTMNQLLQGKPREAGSDAARVFINTTLGFAGFADVASSLGFEKHSEDFGQTLGRWGFGTGPYLVLPLLGPSSVRDGAGTVLDLSVDPLGRVIAEDPQQSIAQGVRLLGTRAALLDAGRMLDGVALDKYAFVRDAWLQRRRSQVWDGDPPTEPESREPADKESE